MKLQYCVLLAMSLQSVPLVAAALYAATDLGTLGGSSTVGYGINNAGQVTGFSQTAQGETHAFLYSKGQMIDLGTLGGNLSAGRGIDDAGQITGYANTPSAQHAFLYTNGHMTDLDPTGVWSLGTAINNVGQVAGSFYVTAHGPAHAFMYASGRLNDLGTLKGSCCSAANGINNLGQITGGSRYPSQTGSNDHAFLYSSGQMTDLTESLGGCCSIGFAINNTGQITGSLVSQHAADAFLYSRSQVLLLGNLGRDVTGSYGINDAGQVVGLSEVADGAFHAFIYSDGKIADLNSLVELDPRLHITLSEASAINNDGQIVANGYGPTGYEQRAFLLTPVPVPEPGTLALILGALVACGFLRIARG